jgi:hypothetical protein
MMWLRNNAWQLSILLAPKLGLPPAQIYSSFMELIEELE